MAQNPVPKPGTDPVVRLLFWLLFFVAIAVVLEFRGPYQGWVERLAKTIEERTPPNPPAPTAATAPDTAEAVATSTTQPTETISTDPPAPPSPAKSEAEKLYDALFEKHMAALKPPTIGNNYKIKLRDRNIVEGQLSAVSPGKVVLKVPFGTMTYPVHRIDPSCYPFLFPEQIAKRLALKDLQAQLTPPEPEPVAPKPITAARPAAPARPKPTETAPPPPLPKPDPLPMPDPVVAARFAYDTAPEPTPDHLQSKVQEFGMWLRQQHRRLGGKLANKIYAKQHGYRVVLYIDMHQNFLVQDYDLRHQLAESIWKLWSFRCLSGGKVANVEDSHICLLTNGKQIGGSTPEDGAAIWVDTKNHKRKRRRI